MAQDFLVPWDRNPWLSRDKETMRQAQNAGTGHVTEGKLITFFCLNHFQDVRAEILQIFGSGFLENFRDQKLFLKLHT